jgi:hypothetical protein
VESGLTSGTDPAERKANWTQAFYNNGQTKVPDSWAETFGERSVYGRATGDPYGTANNPIRFGGEQLAAITAGRIGSDRSAPAFMPDQTGAKLVLPKPITGPSGNAATDAAALARNMAETLPGGMDGYLPPKPSRPDWSSVTDTPTGAPDFTALNDDGVKSLPPPEKWSGLKFANRNPVTAAIEKKYGNKAKPGFISWP